MLPRPGLRPGNTQAAIAAAASRKPAGPAIMSFIGSIALGWRSRLVASLLHRVATRLTAGCALLLVVSLYGCAASRYTDVSNSGAGVDFKVPSGWHQIDALALARELQAEVGGTGGAWTVAYEAGQKLRATDFLSFTPTQPYVFAEAGALNSTASRELSNATLRDFFLPVTPVGRQAAAAKGFPLTGFRQIRDRLLTLGQGVHGIRETYEYTYTGRADTFDVDALTNADHNFVFLLVVHCTTTCYSRYQTDIAHVMSSVTTSRFGQPKPPYDGLIGR
jgi:hypothetical protein